MEGGEEGREKGWGKKGGWDGRGERGVCVCVWKGDDNDDNRINKLYNNNDKKN
jgi:hypothetical protein